MTKCGNGKRRLILAALFAAAIFTGGMTAGSDVFAAEAKAEAEAEAEMEDKSEAESGAEGGAAVKSVGAEESADVKSVSAETSETEEAAAEEQSESEAAVEDGEVQNGWVEEGDNTCYYVDGEKVTNTIMEIDGKLYSFSSYGYLMKGASFSRKDSDSGITYYYRSKDDGSLRRNEWYEVTSSNGDKLHYHYGEDGRGERGIVTLDGEELLFDYKGLLMEKKACYVDDVAYAGDADGHPVKLSDDGWNTVGGAKFYTESGSFLEKKLVMIKDAYYFFTDYGVMLAENKTAGSYFYDPVTDQYVSRYYRGKKNGKLYRNEWYNDGSEDYPKWHYYGDDCSEYFGFHTINGKSYFFHEYYGDMLTDTTCSSSDGYSYVIDKDGIATRLDKEGWNKVGDRTYYVVDGKPVEEKILEIGGKLYGFGYDGQMLYGGYFTLYVKEGDDYILHSYCAREDGSLYTGTWHYVEHEQAWFYFGKDGAAKTGFCKIGGTLYYFGYYGDLQTNTSLTHNGKLYVVNENGEAKELPVDSWTTFKGKTYYNDGGSLVKSAVKKIGDKYYYFESNGALMKGQRVCYNGTYYRAGKDGALLTDQWYNYEYYTSDGSAPDNGKYKVGKNNYYFYCGIAQKNSWFSDGEYLYKSNSGGVLKKSDVSGITYLGTYREPILTKNGKVVKEEGWHEINKAYYYVTSDGTVVRDISMQVDGKYYAFRADGTLIRGGWENTSYGDWIYAKGSGELLIGEQTIDGKKYYFDGEGHMMTGLVTIDGVNYIYGSDGVYRKKAVNGWNEAGGDWYYVKNGEFLTGEQKIGKFNYRFYSDGTLKMDWIDYSGQKVYDANGRQVKKGWIKADGYWYYIDPETHKYVTGQQTIDGKTYNFDSYGRLSFDWNYVEYYDNTICSTDKNGVYTEKKITSKWFIVGKEYYYRKDYTGWVGENYVEDGMLVTDAVVDGKYLVDAKGNWVKKQGWYEVRYAMYGYSSTSTFYVKKNKTAAVSEWLQIDGKWYYFSSLGIVQKGPVLLDGVLYFLDQETGKLLRTVKNPDDGWYKAGNDWYYVNCGDVLHWSQWMEHGSIYFFQSSGVMMTDMFGYYSTTPYYGKDGKAVFDLTGWQKVNGKWFFFDNRGLPQFGFVRSGKKMYYVASGYGMLTGYQVLNGQLYQFGKDGALIGRVSCKDGWVKKDGKWFYCKNGEMVDYGFLTIGGKDYCFEEGTLFTDGFHEYYGIFTDKDGVIQKSTWKKINGSWYYFDRDGFMVTGWQTIGGKTYRFRYDGSLVE